MPSDFFLGQTAAEWKQNLPPGAKKAWMACHFSPCGTGLSNLPTQLPPGSMVIVDDQMPVADHDPVLIAAQLEALVAEGNCQRILLDFQRPGQPRTAQIAQAIASRLPCPVGVSHWYAGSLNCSVFVPPLPLQTLLQRHIAPWEGRKLWLELATDCIACSVTADDCRQEGKAPSGLFPHYSETLYCHYRTEVFADAIVFTLRRSCADALKLLGATQIECCIGLYQEFAQPEAQETAFFQ